MAKTTASRRGLRIEAVALIPNTKMTRLAPPTKAQINDERPVFEFNIISFVKRNILF